MTKTWIACAYLLAAGVAVAAEPALKPLYGTPFVMPVPMVEGLSGKAVLPLPVTLDKGLSPEHVCIEKVGVRFLNVVDGAVDARFEVEPALAATADAVPTIRVGVTDPARLLPGVYEVLLRAIDCKPGQPRKPLDSLVVALTRPGVKLEPPGKVTVDQWLATPWSLAASAVNPTRLTIRPTEESKLSPITQLQADASSFTTSGTGINVGAWIVKAVSVPVVPGNAVQLSLAPSGFPVGVASGHIDLRGPDLLAPLRIDVDVRTRLIGFWIPAVVGLGVLLGWLLRHLLQRRVELARARKPGFDELERLRGELDRIGDAQFIAAVEPSLLTLQRSLEGDDIAAVATASAAVRGAVDVARSKLNDALRDVAGRIEVLQADFDVRAPLSEQLAKVCALVPRIVAEAVEAIAASDAVKARRVLDAGDRQLGAELAAAWTEIRVMVEDLLLAYEALMPLLSAPKREILAGAVRDRRAELKAVGMPDRASASGLLRVVAQMGREHRQMLEWAARALVGEAERRDRQTRERVKTKSDLDKPIADLYERTGVLAAAMQAQAQHDSGLARPQWVDAADAVRLATEALLKRVIDLQPVAEQHTIRAAVVGKMFDEAIGAVLVDDPHLSMDRSLSIHPEPQIAAAARGFAEVAHPSRDGPQVLIALRDIAVARNRNLAELLRAEVWMGLAVAFVLAVVSYAFYEERFIGTWPEMLGLFLWGFSADLGADKIVTKVRELGVAPKP